MSVIIANTQGACATLATVHQDESGEAYQYATWLYIFNLTEIGGGGGANMSLTINRTAPGLKFSFHNRFITDGGSGVRPSFVRCNDAGGVVSHFSDGATPESIVFGNWYMLSYQTDATVPDTVKIGVKPWGGSWTFSNVVRASATPTGIPTITDTPTMFAGDGNSAAVWPTPGKCAGWALWNRLLSEAELIALTHPLQNRTGLTNYWPCDSKAGNVLRDAIGSNTATLVTPSAFTISSDAPAGYPTMTTASFPKTTRISSATPDANYGAETSVRIGAQSGGAHSRALLGGLTFTGSYGLPATGATITAATLACANQNTGAALASAMEWEALAADFTEGTIPDGVATADGVTYNTQPSVIASSASSGALDTGTGAKTWNVLTAIQKLYAAGDNIGLRGKRTTESGTTSTAIYDSDDLNANAWTLDITATGYPPRLSADRLSTSRLSSDRLSLSRLA